jgi:hypothetical protein
MIQKLALSAAPVHRLVYPAFAGGFASGLFLVFGFPLVGCTEVEVGKFGDDLIDRFVVRSINMDIRFMANQDLYIRIRRIN